MSVNDLIESLNTEQLYALVKDIKTLPKNRVVKVDTSYRERRNNITDLYFRAVPRASMFQSIDKYNQHADSIREQVISGVDL